MAKITMEEPTDLSEVTKYKSGKIPVYREGNMRGVANCPDCNKCVGNLLNIDVDENTVVGWFHIKCDCGCELDWSTAHEHIHI